MDFFPLNKFLEYFHLGIVRELLNCGNDIHEIHPSILGLCYYSYVD